METYIFIFNDNKSLASCALQKTLFWKVFSSASLVSAILSAGVSALLSAGVSAVLSAGVCPVLSAGGLWRDCYLQTLEAGGLHFTSRHCAVFKKKSRIRETPTLSTDADHRTDIYIYIYIFLVEWTIFIFLNVTCDM